MIIKSYDSFMENRGWFKNTLDFLKNIIKIEEPDIKYANNKVFMKFNILVDKLKVNSDYLLNIDKLIYSNNLIGTVHYYGNGRCEIEVSGRRYDCEKFYKSIKSQ